MPHAEPAASPPRPIGYSPRPHTVPAAGARLGGVPEPQYPNAWYPAAAHVRDAAEAPLDELAALLGPVSNWLGSQRELAAQRHGDADQNAGETGRRR